jgi:hypothetical protein
MNIQHIATYLLNLLHCIMTGKFKKRALGMDKGAFITPDDFDEPLPPEIMRYFEKTNT